MKRIAFALAGIAGLCAAPVCFAGSQPTFYFGKANVSDAEFVRDRDACSHEATKPVWGSAQRPLNYVVGPMTPSSAPPQNNSGGTVTTLKYGNDASVFVRCMLAKGYIQGEAPKPAAKPAS